MGQYLPCINKTRMDVKTAQKVIGGFLAGIVTTMILTLVAHHYLSPGGECNSGCVPTNNTQNLMSFVAGIVTTILMCLAHQYFSPGDSGCVLINKKDSYKKVGSLRFHLERSGKNGLRTDKIYPCLTREIHTEGPYRVVVNNGKLLVSERQGDFVSVRDLNGKLAKVISMYGSHGEGRGEMISPAGIALDDEGFVYVTSDHKLQKFSPGGSFIAEIGGSENGNQPGEAFDRPLSVAIRNDKVYVCDSINNRIQVFSLHLQFLECIAIKKPQDISFDNEGKMYVTSMADHLVYVFDESGNIVHQFGQQNSDGIGLIDPTGIHIYGNYVLVSDDGVNSIMVYSITGQFITSFGGFNYPRGITSDDKGQIYICDYQHHRIVVL